MLTHYPEFNSMFQAIASHDYRVPRALLVGARKGGVGKTTYLRAIATMLAIAGKKVLVLDADHQNHSALLMLYASYGLFNNVEEAEAYLDDNEDKIYNIRDIILGYERGNKIILPIDLECGGTASVAGSLDLIPSHEMLRENEQGGPADQRQAALNINAVLRELVRVNKYDLVLIDTGPGNDIIYRAALTSATDAIVPFNSSILALHGAQATADDILTYSLEREERKMSSINFLGFLPSMVAGNKLIQVKNMLEREETLSRKKLPIFDSEFRYRQPIEECENDGVFPWELRKTKGRSEALSAVVQAAYDVSAELERSRMDASPIPDPTAEVTEIRANKAGSPL